MPQVLLLLKMPCAHQVMNRIPRHLTP